MERDRERIVAQSLSAQDIALLPYIPYFLQDLWELGSDPQVIVDLLSAHASIGARSRILDLGCGKGAVSITLAKAFGCIVQGRDLMIEFIDDARRRAEEHGVQSLCTFLVEDVVGTVECERGNDVVIFGAEGAVFPDIHTLLHKLKGTVRSNGYIILDDVYVPEGYVSHDYLSLSAWHSAFAQAGLEISDAVETDSSVMQKMNRCNQLAIERRARELIERYPEQEKLFTSYVADQQAECDLLDSTLIATTWLLHMP